MATRNVVLSPHQHEFVEALVSSGRYQDANEVLRAGLRLLERQEAEDAAKVSALRDAADSGWADLSAGRYDDVADENLEDFISQLGAHAAQGHSAG
ncbi:type II toxin-antitoxin system ParD family antitoxin [Ornithinimicrobium faecis]|uniref:Type II toxin-antitoxin system ParD family antitoxin n=1 Tax=Ornithinimicrobium faecis TaxID=2934158 RepID=A0ABY4YWR7_9MICO|nr:MULTISPECIES: type II toxin-antitoxin system ParD family antitoxin [unclassified Ornithinimicrobium]USQ81096.1 type II toxin-antitoxin system ParD family antitoxin [Ornithinimicrobium sp. HY1793]